MIQRVGVIGGGQLAQMMAEVAPSLGIQLIAQTPSPTDPVVGVAEDVILAELTDPAATADLSRRCQVITFENEFIDLEALQPLADSGVCFRPSLSALAPLLDKLDQRTFLRGLGIPIPDLAVGFPLVLKVRRNGYDGKGTFIVQDADEWVKVSEQVRSQAVYLEQWIPFERELAVMAARSADGSVVLYPVVETFQKDQVCRWVKAPASIPETTVQQIHQIATQLLTALDWVGILGIEFFLTPESEVLVNELAPRTHNSGHYTLDACPTSQFAQQLRAVAGLPLGSVDLDWDGALMVNLLGYEHATSDYATARQALSSLPNAHLYWYGKTVSRPGRKLGHITVRLTGSVGECDQQARTLRQQIESIWEQNLDPAATQTLAGEH